MEEMREALCGSVKGLVIPRRLCQKESILQGDNSMGLIRVYHDLSSCFRRFPRLPRGSSRV